MAKYIKVKTKTVDEWLALRQPRIGGSEISAVVGLSPWESKYELYLRKKGEAQPQEENVAMMVGHGIEDTIAGLVQKIGGYQIIKNTSGNLIYLSEDYPFAEASPDRLAYLPGTPHTEANKCIVECKSTSKTIDPDNLPEHWICQVQWYMAITGIHEAVIAWLTFPNRFDYKHVSYNESFCNLLLEEGRKFADDLINNIEPEPITAADMIKKFPRHTEGKSIEVSEDVALACERYKQLKANISTLENEKDACEEVIKRAIADAESIAYSGLVLATFKTAKDTEKFDAKSFKEANPELAAQYTKVVPGSRRLTVK